MALACLGHSARRVQLGVLTEPWSLEPVAVLCAGGPCDAVLGLGQCSLFSANGPFFPTAGFSQHLCEG